MLNLTEAFNTLSHELLVNKLWHYAFHETAYRLLLSSFTNRMQYVDLNKFSSSLQRIDY